MVYRIASALGFIWSFLPLSARRLFFKGLIVLESRARGERIAIGNICFIKDFATKALNERALYFNDDVHPKHRIMHYHKFFSSWCDPGEAVLDLGCGSGTVAHAIAESDHSLHVVGVDYDDRKIKAAKAKYVLPNLEYLLGDITKEYTIVNGRKFDVVVLSNVLEHIDERVGLLKAIKTAIAPKTLLVRVPNIERDWEVLYRKELNLEYRCDLDHRIEHDKPSLENELSSSGWKIELLETCWGEFWLVAR